MMTSLYKSFLDQQTKRREILARITYKPNWTLEVWGDHLHVAADVGDAAVPAVPVVPDVSDPRKIVKIAIGRTIPEDLKEADFVDFIRHAITDLELHERDEWFKFDGVPVKEPHVDRMEKGK
jgi:hypothetical protein